MTLRWDLQTSHPLLKNPPLRTFEEELHCEGPEASLSRERILEWITMIINGADSQSNATEIRLTFSVNASCTMGLGAKRAGAMASDDWDRAKNALCDSLMNQCDFQFEHDVVLYIVRATVSVW